ncbi:hypothetical protein N7495_010041 [Penicillium taxi]|uniref:uncharacterized protein n=1 Tax=Penicillium taxi TaxID=168475 RepID=UPI0025454155|nr:uncharacterized protein N7495_010041 [Penicillium taxi]KAJ5885531.1 hypothetical protein N7495_010041 [Penicillium taxi]
MSIIFNALPLLPPISEYGEPFYRSVEQAIEAINIHAQPQGFAVSKRSSQLNRIQLRCARADFHPHWHLPEAPSIQPSIQPFSPPIPASQVQNPPKAITRGRPPASSARQAISQRSTQRSPSQFEITEQQILAENQEFEVSRAASQASQAGGEGGASQASAAGGAGWEASEDEGPRRSGRAPRPKRRRTDETTQGETTETDH